MAPYRSFDSKPALKSGVDLQLQSAYSEENWLIVSRLADKRARISKDPYYDVLKACAIGQLDSIKDRFAVVELAHKYLKDATPMKDADALDLLEWGCLKSMKEADYPTVVGPLRAKLVKAVPKDQIIGERCLTACLLHWDLVNAQQIAAMMDRSFPKERHYMFWNIAITHLLSISDQGRAEMKALYGTLALKQIQKAAQLADQALADGPERSVRNEEEALLLFELTAAHGSDSDLHSVVDSAKYGAIKQFQSGRKELLVRVLDYYVSKDNLLDAYNLCNDCLSQRDENQELSLLACDWAMWKHFIRAAAGVREVILAAPTQVKSLLEEYLSSKKLPAIYRRNLLLAKVQAVFDLVPCSGLDAVDGQAKSQRLVELINYMEAEELSVYLFDDAQGFVEQLDETGLKFLAYTYLPQRAEQAKEPKSATAIGVTACKVQYLVATCPQSMQPTGGSEPAWSCLICNKAKRFTSRSCSACFGRIAQSTIRVYKVLSRDTALESMSELSIVIALCLIRQSHLSIQPQVLHPPLLSSKRLLQAALILESQSKLVSKDNRILSLLLRIYLLLGCATKAQEVYRIINIKRSIIVSLGPLFYDRIAGISPHMVDKTDRTGRSIMDNLRNHFAASLHLRMPRKMLDAYASHSYSSVLAIPPFIEKLRANCSRITSFVEETRAARAVGGIKFGNVQDDDRTSQITDNVLLAETIDFGSFPNWESSSAQPIHSILSLGPKPSNTRSHLARLTESYHQLLAYKPPTGYKPTGPSASASVMAEEAYFLESIQRLNNSFARFLASADMLTTSHECLHYQILHLLTGIIPMCLAHEETSKGPDSELHAETLEQFVVAASAGLGLLAELPSSSPKSTNTSATTGAAPSMPAGLSVLTSLYPLSQLRDAASATKLAVAYLTAHHERATKPSANVSTTCQAVAPFPKTILGHIRVLDSAASAALKRGKAYIAQAHSDIGNPNFQSNIRRWVLYQPATVGMEDWDAECDDAVDSEAETVQSADGQADVAENRKQVAELLGASVDSVVTDVVMSWRENIKTWGNVKWE